MVLKLFLLFSFFPTAILGSIGEVGHDCFVQTRIEAPPLSPGRLVNGEAHLLLSGPDCWNASGWTLGLRCKEREFARLVADGIVLPEYDYELDTPQEPVDPSVWVSPYMQKLQNRTLWDIHAEQRLVFDARIDLILPNIGFGIPRSVVKPFTLAVPFTNFPSTSYGSYYSWSGRDMGDELLNGEEILEYYSFITFRDASTIEQRIGTTEFIQTPELPTPSANAPRTFTVLVDTTELGRHETEDTRPSCDEGGPVGFEATFFFPNGTEVIENDHLPFTVSLTPSVNNTSSLRISTITAWIEYIDSHIWARSFANREGQGYLFSDYPSPMSGRDDVCKLDTHHLGHAIPFHVLASTRPTFERTYISSGARLRLEFGTEYGCEVDAVKGGGEQAETIQLNDEADDEDHTWSSHYCGKPFQRHRWRRLEVFVPLTIIPDTPRPPVVVKHYLDPDARVPKFMDKEELAEFEKTQVKAPLLAPGQLVNGEAHLLLSGPDCWKASGWTLGLRCKEREFARLIADGMVLPEYDHELDGPQEPVDPRFWVSPYMQKLQNRTLWDIHAEERLVFDAQIDLVSPGTGFGVPRSIIKTFTLAIPFTNFPSTWFGSYYAWSGRDIGGELINGEQILEYYSLITFRDGLTVEKRVGTTGFIRAPETPVPSAHSPQTFTVLVDSMAFNRYETGDTRPSCDEGGSVGFEATFSFPNGTEVTRNDYLAFTVSLTPSANNTSSLRITTITAWIEHIDNHAWARSFATREDQRYIFDDYPTRWEHRDDVCKLDTHHLGHAIPFHVLADTQSTFERAYLHSGARLRLDLGTEYGCEVDAVTSGEQLETIWLNDASDSEDHVRSSHYCGKPRPREWWRTLEVSVPLTIIPDTPRPPVVVKHYLDPDARVPKFLDKEELAEFENVELGERHRLFPLARTVAQRKEEVREGIYWPRIWETKGSRYTSHTESEEECEYWTRF